MIAANFAGHAGAMPVTFKRDRQHCKLPGTFKIICSEMQNAMAWPPLSKRLHVALKGLCCLAQSQGPVRAHELARCAGVPPAHAAKILYLLTWGGFVSSRRGSKGGFWLRRPPEQIRIRDVMRFFQAPAEAGRGKRRDPVLEVWRETAAPARETFERLTLADLVREGDASRFFKCKVSDEEGWRYFA